MDEHLMDMIMNARVMGTGEEEVLPIGMSKKKYAGEGTKAGAAHNPWMKHLKKWRKEHPNVKGKEAMIRARKSYKPMKGGKKSGSKTAKRPAKSLKNKKMKKEMMKKGKMAFKSAAEKKRVIAKLKKQHKKELAAVKKVPIRKSNK